MSRGSACREGCRTAVLPRKVSPTPQLASARCSPSQGCAFLRKSSSSPSSLCCTRKPLILLEIPRQIRQVTKLAINILRSVYILSQAGLSRSGRWANNDLSCQLSSPPSQVRVQKHECYEPREVSFLKGTANQRCHGIYGCTRLATNEKEFLGVRCRNASPCPVQHTSPRPLPPTASCKEPGSWFLSLQLGETLSRLTRAQAAAEQTLHPIHTEILTPPAAPSLTQRAELKPAAAPRA